MDQHDPSRGTGPAAAPERVWLALPPRHPDAALLDAARDAVAGLAETLAAVLPVTVLVSPEDAAGARLVPRAADRLATSLDTPLIGRTGPSFVRDGGAVRAVDWRLDPTGRRLPLRHDAGVAAAVAREAGLRIDSPLLAAPPTAWVTDGEGTAAVSAALLGTAAGAGWTRELVEEELSRVLGVRRVLWLPLAAAPVSGPYGGPAHLHPWVRFTGGGAVAVLWDSRRLHPDHLRGAAAVHALQDARDAAGRVLRVRTVPPAPDREDSGIAGEGTGPLSPLDVVALGGHVLRPSFADPAADARAAEVAALVAPEAAQVAFPLAPLLLLAGGLSDLVLVQPRP